MSRFPHAEFLLSVAAPSQFPPDEGVEVAFAGRSNAGKSSAINAILERRSLVRTSKTPGQTRLLNYFSVGEGRRIVDLPGYGYAAVPPAERTRWIPLIDRLRTRRAFAGLFLIVDARRGLTGDDARLIEWASPASPAFHVLLTKADKLTRNDARATLAKARDALDGAVEGPVTVQLFSAKSRDGVDAAQQALLSILTAARPQDAPQ